MKIYLEGRKNGYSAEQCGETFTVKELIEFLKNNFDEDDKIYLKNDNGYTYGNIDYFSFSTEEDEDEEEIDY